MIYWWFFIEINISEINKYPFIIIDIRDSFSYQKHHLEKAINIPFTKLIINPENYLNKNNNYLLICEYGIKSKKTSIILNKLGYKTYSLANGMHALNYR